MVSSRPIVQWAETVTVMMTIVVNVRVNGWIWSTKKRADFCKKYSCTSKSAKRQEQAGISTEGKEKENIKYSYTD
jgi:hypothetical protein